MSNDHPTFPNPMIQEALCEIHFCLPAGAEWRSSVFSDLFTKLQPDFPALEPLATPGFQIEIGPGGAGRAFLPPQQRMRYRHATRNLLLQLSEGIISVNVLPKYPGWSQMSSDILSAWARTREVVKPQRITRIGLRYINRIGRTRPNEPAGEWLAANPYIPSAVLSSLPGFLSRLEARADEHNRLIVTAGETAPGPEDSGRAIVFDIDCISEKEIEVSDAALAEEASRLHEIAWQVFSASMTSRLTERLKGGEGT